MPDIFLAAHAAEQFKRLSPHHRQRALKLFEEIRETPAHANAIRIRSAVLDTSLLMIRSAALRLVYETTDDRTVILSIHDNIRTEDSGIAKRRIHSTKKGRRPTLR